MNEKFFIQEYVRWQDIDYAGAIFYGAYLRFFELAEMELFRSIGLPYGKVFEELDIWLPRVQVHCDFYHPAVLDDLLNISTFVGRIGSKSITLNFEVHRAKDNLFLASGHFVIVVVSRKDFKSIPLLPILTEKLSRFTLS